MKNTRYIKAWPNKQAQTGWFVQVPGHPARLFSFTKHGKRITAAARYRASLLKALPKGFLDAPAPRNRPERTQPLSTSKLGVLGVDVRRRIEIRKNGSTRVRTIVRAQIMRGPFRKSRHFEVTRQRPLKAAITAAAQAYQKLREDAKRARKQA